MKSSLPEHLRDRIIEMAWEDRTPFDAIQTQFGVTESEVITIMRRHLKRRSFQRWRARVSGRSTKHKAKAPEDVSRHRCPTQGKLK